MSMNCGKDQAVSGPESAVATLLAREDIWYGWTTYHRQRFTDRVLRLMQGAVRAAKDEAEGAETAHLLGRIRGHLWSPYIHPELRMFFLNHEKLWMDIKPDGELMLREGYWKPSDDPDSPSPGSDDIKKLERVFQRVNEDVEESSIPRILLEAVYAGGQRIIGWIIPYLPSQHRTKGTAPHGVAKH